MPSPVQRVRRRSAHRRHGALAALALLVMACDGDTSGEPPTSTEAPQPDAEAYGTALATILDDPPAPEGERTVVYVVPLDESLGIDAQASVIDRFADAYDVRFVDDLEAAVRDDDANHPPRDDGIVVGLGTITLQSPHRVRLEQYVSAGDVRATRVTLERGDDGWVVATTDPVPAEVLVDVG